jgi:hypothetical protein
MLVRKTLRTLSRGRFNGSLFVIVPSEELAAYQTAVLASDIHCIILHCERGLVKQRKFFREQMLPGTEIVFIDDDIEAIKLLTPVGLEHCSNLPVLANYIFYLMSQRDKCFLAGVYPMANRLSMRSNITVGNAYIVGALYFCINDPAFLEPEEDECEDWSRCLSEQAAGREVLRFNWIGIVTQYWKNAGGMQKDRSLEKRAAKIAAYGEQFKSLVRVFNRKSGHPDFRYLNRAVPWADALMPAMAAPSTSDDQSTASAAPDVLSAPAGHEDPTP